MAQLHDDPPCLNDFVGVSWPESNQARYRAQRNQLFDRLVSRPIFADPDRVVREDIDDGDFHERREPDRRTHIVAEDQEARAKGPNLGQCHAVENRAHRVLTNAKVQIAPAVVRGSKVAGSLECKPSFGGRRQIGGSTHHPRHLTRNRIQHLGGSVPPGYTLYVGWKVVQIPVPPFGQFAPLHLIKMQRQFRVLAGVLEKHFLPAQTQLGTAFADSVLEVLSYPFGNVEFCIFRPTIIPLGQVDFLFTEWLAMGSAGVLLVGSAVSNVAVNNDQSRPIIGVQESLKGPRQHRLIIRVSHTSHIPTVAEETGRYILTERQLGVALDRDPVVVVNPAEIRKLKMTSQRRSLSANTFHHATVATHGVYVVVEKFKAGTIEVFRHPTLGKCHAHAGCNSLAERSSSGFDSRSPAVFGMSRTLAF